MNKIIKRFIAAILAAALLILLPAAASAEISKSNNYYEKAFSASHLFRDIFVKQYGSGKVYDDLANIFIEMLYDDSIKYGEQRVLSFSDEVDVAEFGAALVSVQHDLPFIPIFLFCAYSYSFRDGVETFEVTATKEMINCETVTDAASYKAAFLSTVSELKKYRSAVMNITDEEKRLEAAAKLLTDNSVYDLSAPFHVYNALMTRIGICGTAAWSMSLIGHAIGIPSYSLGIGTNHAVTLVQTANGFKIIDTTFGVRNPKLADISQYKNQIKWETAFGLLSSYFFPDIDFQEFFERN